MINSSRTMLEKLTKKWNGKNCQSSYCHLHRQMIDVHKILIKVKSLVYQLGVDVIPARLL